MAVWFFKLIFYSLVKILWAAYQVQRGAFSLRTSTQVLMIILFSWFFCSASVKQHHEEVLTRIQYWKSQFDLSAQARCYNIRSSHAVAATCCSNTSVGSKQSKPEDTGFGFFLLRKWSINPPVWIHFSAERRSFSVFAVTDSISHRSAVWFICYGNVSALYVKSAKFSHDAEGTKGLLVHGILFHKRPCKFIVMVRLLIVEICFVTGQ